MGSKKHKKESKKKKHRSKSRSPLEGEERERKRHRKHKDRKRDRSPDVEEVPVDSHLQKNEQSERMRSRSRSASAERDRRMRDQHRAHRDASDGLRDKSYELERETEKSPVDVAPKPQESLSVEETNRLRAKLGLKPLEVAEKPADDGKFKDDLGEFYHKPAVNIAQQKKTEKLKEKLEQRKEKRKLEKKLQTTLLAQETDDEDAIAWVQRSRDIEKQKREAAKRAAMLDEMDEVFGVSALVAEEVKTSNQNSYQPKDLQGLRVAHDIDTLGDERETVLTLADKEVLADDDEDVLVNVNIVDNEKYKKNIEERRKARAGYQAYDEEAELEASLGFQRPVLSKYDELIDQDKPLRTRGFRIGDDDAIEAKKFRDLMRQERRAGGADKRLESLQLPELRIASDYMDEHELQAKFKKPKKKGKMRKKQKEEPIDVDDYDEGLVPLDTDDTEVNLEQLKSGLAVDEEETEPDTELQAALARARRLRQLELAEQKLLQIPKVEEILERVKEEENAEEGEEQSGAMVFDATAEFCRTLGDIPTYGLAGNREHTAQPMEEDELDVKANGDADVDMSSEANAGAWSRVDVHTDKQPDLTAGSSVALDAEPALGCGVGGALQLALSKGYLERPGAGAGAGGAGAGGAGAGAAGAGARNPEHRLVTALAARHYSIEDKTYGGEDDKYGRRERGHSGPLQDFREKQNFRPSIKLEYVDDEGRPLRPKEAFRYLSHKFHGKGPGKNKQEKRIKKAIQEGLMKKMSSTDTPLGTLQMLQEKQRETHSPFILLSGAKRDPNN